MFMPFFTPWNLFRIVGDVFLKLFLDTSKSRRPGFRAVYFYFTKNDAKIFRQKALLYQTILHNHFFISYSSEMYDKTFNQSNTNIVRMKGKLEAVKNPPQCPNYMDINLKPGKCPRALAPRSSKFLLYTSYVVASVQHNTDIYYDQYHFSTQQFVAQH